MNKLPIAAAVLSLTFFILGASPAALAMPAPFSGEAIVESQSKAVLVSKVGCNCTPRVVHHRHVRRARSQWVDTIYEEPSVVYVEPEYVYERPYYGYGWDYGGWYGRRGWRGRGWHGGYGGWRGWHRGRGGWHGGHGHW